MELVKQHTNIPNQFVYSLNKNIMGTNLCKCNNCNSILIDQNPQIGAKEFELDGTEKEMVKNMDKDSEDYFAWVCPECKTDGYLIDL